MEKRRGRNRHRNWNDQKKQNNQNNQNSQRNNNGSLKLDNQKNRSKFKYVPQDDSESQARKAQAIQDFKAKEVICPVCGQPITDVASAIADKSSGNPIHFECVMEKLSQTEKVGQNEKICYIGQGRFGVLYFENPRDQRHFTIKKIIDWEEKDKSISWREEMSSLYSQID